MVHHGDSQCTKESMCIELEVELMCTNHMKTGAHIIGTHYRHNKEVQHTKHRDPDMQDVLLQQIATPFIPAMHHET